MHLRSFAYLLPSFCTAFEIILLSLLEMMLRDTMVLGFLTEVFLLDYWSRIATANRSSES